MKIKTRPDDADMLESGEWFQMNGWLAELREVRRAESEDDGRAEWKDDGCAEWKDDGWTESKDDAWAESEDDGQAGPREDRRAEPQDGSQAGSPDAGQAGPRKDGLGEPRGDGRAWPRDDGHVEPRDARYTEPRYDGRSDPHGAGRAGLRYDGHAEPPRHGYPRPEAVATAPLNRPFVRPATTGRALIGDELRRPIAWCELGPCISWYADPAALGEADIRTRAISAGWRFDAIGLLVCPQCQQTAPGFRSPLPVALWDRGAAISAATRIATEPGDDPVSIVAREPVSIAAREPASIAAQELSHDLRLPAEDHRDEAIAASTWMPAVPSDIAVSTATREDRDEARRPASDHHPESHPRSGRHRKRLVAKLRLASR